MPTDPEQLARELGRKVAPCVCVIHGRTPGEVYDHGLMALVMCRDCTGTGVEPEQLAHIREALSDLATAAHRAGRVEAFGEAATKCDGKSHAAFEDAARTEDEGDDETALIQEAYAQAFGAAARLIRTLAEEADK